MAVDGFWEKDYQLNDLRANSVVSDVPVVGFKIYATRDKENYKENGYVVNKSVYLKQTGGEVLFYDGEENKFFNFSLPLIKSGESATSATEGFVSFYPQILNDDEYLKQMFGNISSLQTLSTVETFYYVVAAVDALKQESIINYILPVTYDFRLAAEFQEGTTPVLINSGFTSVTVNEKTGYLFHGQTDIFDWITFEWYPAFNKNDYLLNPSNYEEINGNYYLKADKDDPNNYTLYKWINGEYRSKRLIVDNDFKATTDTSLGKEVKKYIAKYAMNLKDSKVSEYFNLTLMPSYIDKYKEEKMATPIETLNSIKENNEIVYFHLSRFIPMEISIDSSKIHRTDQTEFIVELNTNNWGILTGEGINSISSKMILRNSSIVADDGNAEKEILSNKQGSFELEVTPTYGVDQIVYDFKGHASKIYDNMPFSSETIITITINRFSEKDYTISKSGTSSITTTYNYYIPANFSTLSLRKNKVGINYSNLTNTEEALYVVAKDRIDSGNDIGNVAVYGDTYPHVFSIQGNLQTKMPNFNKDTGMHIDDSLNVASIYMGFYTLTSKNDDDDEELLKDNPIGMPYRVGSFGMEEGYPYFVYKGKYYGDKTLTTVKINENETKNIQKRFNNKDYFEKVSIADLPIPVGTIVMFPKLPITENYTENDVPKQRLSNTMLHEFARTWFVCNGDYELNPKSHGQLIKHLYGEGGTPNADGLYQVPDLEPTGLSDYCYIIKGDA